MAGGDRAANHLSPDQVHRFLSGEMSGSEATSVVAHLLTRCQLCREQMASLAAVIFAKGEPPDPAPDDCEDYDFPLFRSFAVARRYANTLKTERQELREKLTLQEAPPPPPLSAQERSARDERLCRTLIEHSRSLRQSDPEAMVLTASLAVSIAEQIASKQSLSHSSVMDLQTRSWAELGNARRVAGDLAGSEIAFSHALKRAEEGTGDPRLLALLMDLTASLYIDQRRLTEAAQLLDSVYTVFQSLGEPHHAGRALISKGIAIGYSLNADEAVRLLSQGLRMIDSTRDSKLVLAGVHSLLYFLVEAECFEEASRLLETSRPLYAAQGGKLDQLKARWLEGLIASGKGDDQTAERLLHEVRTGFADANLPYDAALASLSLAEVRLRAGSTRVVEELADEMVAIFRAHHIRREAIGAMLLQSTARKGRPRSA